MGSGHQARDQPELASSNQRRVASSVQPGTAKRAPGAVTPWLGRTMTCRGSARCTFAALAEEQRAIKRPKAKTERIAFAPSAEDPTHQRCNGFLTIRYKRADAVAAIQMQNAGLYHNTNQSLKLWLGIARSS